MKNIFVSVVIPNYNHARFLEQRIESVLNQSYQNFEIILLDDCSSDDSVKILDQYSKNAKVSHLIKNTENSGSPFIQWKKGIEFSKGDFIWIAESDDFSEPFFLNEMVEAIKEKPSIDIIYSQSYDVDENGVVLFSREEYTSEFTPNIWQNQFRFEGLIFIREYLKVKNVIPNASAVLFKKDLIPKDIFSNDFLDMKMCGDWLFWVKLCEKGEIAFNPKRLNFFRDHSGTSRNHNFRSKFVKRLIEEAKIREYLSNLKIEQKVEINKLYDRWYHIHKLKDLARKGFYSVKLSETSYLSFLSNFMRYRLND